MTITVSTSDPRSVKALALLEGAATWQKGRTHDGRSFYCVPSSSVPGLFHMAGTRDCSCKDREHRGVDCCHVLAVRLHVAKLGGTRQPTRRPRPRDAGLGPSNPSDLDRQATPKAAAEYGEIYGADPGHNPATCRLTVCADC